MRKKLTWLANTRQGYFYAISQLAQVTTERCDKVQTTTILCLSKKVRFAIDNPVTFKVWRLHLPYFRVIEFSESSLANSYDHSTQIDHLVFLAD